MRFGLALILATLLGAAALADEDSGRFVIGRDAYLAGQTVTHRQEDRDDLFLAGERATIRADITGSAHVAGRWLSLEGDIGGNLYALGQEVTLEGAVAGNATLAGQEVEIAAPVAGNLRATGSELRIGADIGGYALLAGEEITLDGAVAGDLAMTGRAVRFGDAARVGGTLTLYESEPGSIDVPDRVAPADRVERRRIEEWDHDFGGGREWVGWRGAIGGFLFGVLVVAAVAAAIAALAPDSLAAMRRRILDRPGRSLMVGFVAQSALIGAGIVVALTVIGLLLTPAFMILAVLAGFFGYVIGSYALGVGILSAAGRGEPGSTGDRALAAGVGALAAGLIGLIPFLGWLFVLAVVLTGLGAITVRLLPDHVFGAPRY